MSTTTANIVTFGHVDQRSLGQLERSLGQHGEGTTGVLCADHHVGYGMPIGGVIAYPDHVSPTGVGKDIACGVRATRTNLLAKDVPIPRVMDEIVRRVSFGIGRVNNEPVDHPVLDSIRVADCDYQRSLLDLAAAQLGTVGAGNHYVDLLEDEDGWLWVAAHFGSRGFGFKTASYFFGLAGAVDAMDIEPVLLEASSALGDEYLCAMTLAGQYAYAGRDLVIEKVLSILGAHATEEVHNHHNFAWQEHHNGEDVWVVRKGATPAWPGQLGFVGGSMGDISVVVRGVDSDLSREALYSTVHGAARIMGRKEAAGRMKKRRVLVCVECAAEAEWADSSPACENCGAETRPEKRHEHIPGKVDWPAWQDRLAAEGVHVRGGAADEAPEAYKPLQGVLAAHTGTVEVVHTLRPLGVAMAPPKTHDPFRD